MVDVVIVGGGPGGLSAALALGRSRKQVLVCDAGPRRNAAAEHLNNFLTRDGTPPAEVRRLGRVDLQKYPNVEVRETRVEAISGARGAFVVKTSSGEVQARRILLTTGMIDEMLPVPGYREAWGHSIVQCPFCHGWEVKELTWGYWPQPGHASHFLMFALQLRGWTEKLTVFTGGTFELAADQQAALDAAGIRVETRAVSSLTVEGNALQSVELADGASVQCEILFSHPPQQQVALVKSLGLELDDDGFVKSDPMRKETSVPGIYAAGDLSTRMQGAVLAAAAGTHAAAMINLELTMELAVKGALTTHEKPRS